MTDLDVRALARRLEALEAQVGKRGSQLAYSALEDGAIREFDLEGQQVAQYGAQYDGSHVAASLVGPTPPTPTAPTAQGVAGGVLVGWDGLYADGPTTVAPMDFSRVDVVVGPAGFDPLSTPPATSIQSPRGGLAFISADEGDYEVLFIARSQSGKASLPSARDAATALGAADSGAVTAAQDAADQAIADALVAHILGQQGVDDAAAAQAAADAANSLATLAKNTADAAITVFRQSSAPASGMATNDLWIDSDDGLLYVWTGSWTLSADQRIATVVTSNATKTTIFAQASAPSTSGRTIGDLWIDTDDGNKLYDWSGSWTVRLIGASAISATAVDLGGAPRITAGGTAKTFYNVLTAVPVTGAGYNGLVVIDTPITFTSKMFSIHVKGYNYAATGNTDLDVTLSGYATTTPAITQSSINIPGSMPVSARMARKISTGTLSIILKSEEVANVWQYTRLSVPEFIAGHAGGAAPDTWVSGWSSGVLADEAAVTATYDLIMTPPVYNAGALAAAANSLATTAKNTADSKITVYRQSSAPTGTFKVNDLWLDSDDGLVYFASTTAGAWTLHSDQRIGQVVTSNATKTTVFAQTSQPSTSGRTIGDIWLDTDDGNKIYDWSGSWTVRLIGAPAISATARELGAVTIYRQSAAPVAGMITNDLWVDSDDGLLYVYAGSWLLSADQRVATLVSSNATKITAFSQTSAPSTTGRVMGDLWLDTDDGNKVYVWDGAWTARTLGAAAISATARQLGSINIYRQSTAPVAGLIIGDLWVDADDGLLYIWEGSWSLSADQRVATVVASNAVKVSAFAQASAPSTTGRTLGDIWVDTDDSNKIYVWDGAWTVRLVGAGAISATARQLGAVNIYRQSAAPASGMATNDMWVDSDDGLLYIYTGTWTLSADQRVATLVTQNATQISAFYQTSAPSTSGRTLGDLWFDSDDGFRPYIWTGAWTNVRDTTIAAADAKAVQALADALTANNAAAAAQGTANTALSSANGKTKVTHSDYAPTNEANTVGDTWFVHDTLANGGNIIGQYRGLGGTSWQADTISHQVLASIDLGKATVGKLAANYLESGTMSAAVTVTGYLLSGNPTGARVVIDSDGIRQYTASGDILVNLSTDPDVPAQFEGSIQASSLTVLNNFTLRGVANEIAKGAVLTVSSGTTAPGSAPSIAVGYETYQPPSFANEYLYCPSGTHANVDNSDNILGAKTFFGYGKILGPAGKWWIGPEWTDSTGSKRSKYGNIGSATAVAVGGAERVIINCNYMTANGVAAVGKIVSLDPSVMNNAGTVAPAEKTTLAANADTYASHIKLGRVIGPTSGTKYPDRFALGIWNWSGAAYATGYITLRQYTVTDASIALVATTEKIITSPLIKDEQFIGVTHGDAPTMGFPGAAQYIWLVHGSVNTYAYSSTMARLPQYDFPTPPGAARMNAYGDLATNTFIGFRTTEWDDTQPITKTTNNHWDTTTTSSKWWVSQTWYDADPTVETAPAGGTHETAQGPRAAITMKKRAGLVYTIPTFPERPFPNTTDDVLQARVYLGRSIGVTASDPGRTYMARQATLVSPNRSGFIGTIAGVTLPSAVAAAPDQPPSSSNFPATAPGKITSADGAGWVLAGDGKATLAGVLFDPAFPGFTSSAMRPVATAQGGSVTTNSTTTAVEFASGPHVVFNAPPSGAIWVHANTIIKSGVAGDSAEAIAYVRTGASASGGSIVTSVGMVYNYNTQWVRASGMALVTGLTPGAQYNLYLGVRTNTAGTVASISTSSLGYIPCP